MNRFKRYEPPKKKRFPTRPGVSHSVSVVKGDVISGFHVPDLAPIKSLEKKMEINKQMAQVTQRIEDVINNYVEESNREPLYELSDGTYGTAQLAVDESKGAATMLFVNFEKTGMTKEEVLMSIQKWFESVKSGVRITADDNFTHDPDDPEIDEFLEDTERSAEEMERIKDESTSHLTEIFAEAVKRARKLAIKLSGTQENEEVKQLVQEVQSLLTEGERLNKQIKDLQTQLDKSQREVMEMTTKQNEDFSSIRQRESEMSGQLLEMSDELREAKHDKEVAEEKVTKLEAIFEQLQIEHAREIEDAKSDKNNLHEREKQIEEAERNAKVAKDQLKAKEKENFNIQTQVTHLEAEITKLNQTAIDKAREYQAETVANEQKYKEIQDTYIEQIDDLKQTLEELQVQSQFDKKNIENQEKIITENESQIRQNEIEIEKLKDLLTEIKQKNHQQDTKFKELEDAKTKSDADIENYKQQIADLETDLEKSGKELKASKKELEEIKDALDRNTSLLNQYKNDTSSQLSDQNKLKNQVAKLKREIDDDHKEIESYKADIDTSKKQITDLRNHIKYLENELGKGKSEIHNLNGSLNQVVNDQRKSRKSTANHNPPEPPPPQQQPIQQQQEDDISTVTEMPSIENVPEMVEEEINTDDSLFNPIDLLMVYDINSKEDISCKEILSCYDNSYQGIKFDGDKLQFELYAHTDEDMMTDTDDMMMLKKEEYDKNVETEATRLAEPVYLRIRYLQKKRKQLENELAFYKNQEGKTEDQKIEELFNQINDLMAKKTDLEDIVFKQTTQMQEIEDALDESFKELKEVKEKERTTKDELCAIQKEHCKCKKVIDKLNADIEAANGAISTYKSRRNSRTSISSQPSNNNNNNNNNSMMMMSEFNTLDSIPSLQSSPTHKQPRPVPKQTAEEELIDEIKQLPQNLLAEELQKIVGEGNNDDESAPQLSNEQMIQISSEIASNLENKLTLFLHNIDTQIYDMTNLIVEEDYYDNYRGNNNNNNRDYEEERDKIKRDSSILPNRTAEINDRGELIITANQSTNTSNPSSPTKLFGSKNPSLQVSPSHKGLSPEDKRKSSFDLVINTNAANQVESLDENDLPTKSKLASALRKKVSSHSLLDFNTNISDKNSPTNNNYQITTEDDLEYTEFEGTDLIVNGMMYETNPILQLPTPSHKGPVKYKPDYHLQPTIVNAEKPEVIESIKPKIVEKQKDYDETLSSSSSDSYEGAKIFKDGDNVLNSDSLSKKQRMLTANLCNIESMSFPIIYKDGVSLQYIYILPDGSEMTAEDYELYKQQYQQQQNPNKKRTSILSTLPSNNNRVSQINNTTSNGSTSGIVKGRPSITGTHYKLQNQQSSEETQTKRLNQSIVKDSQGREYIEVKPGEKIKPGENVVTAKDGKKYIEVKPKKKTKQQTVKDAQGREYVELKPGQKAKPGKKIVKDNTGKEYVEVDENDIIEEEDEEDEEERRGIERIREKQREQRREREAPTILEDKPTVKDAQGREYVEVKPGEMIKPGDKIIKGKNGKQYVKVKKDNEEEEDDDDYDDDEQQMGKRKIRPIIKDSDGRQYIKVKPGQYIKPGQKIIKAKDGNKYILVPPEEEIKISRNRPIIRDDDGREYVELKRGEKPQPGLKIMTNKDGKQYIEIPPEQLLQPQESVVVQSVQTGQKITLLPKQYVIQGKDGEQYIEVQPGQKLQDGEQIIKDENGKQYITVIMKSRRESVVSNNSSPNSRRPSITSYKRVSTQMNTLLIGDGVSDDTTYVANNIFLPQPSGIVNKAKIASETQTSSRRVSILKPQNTVSTTQIIVPFVEQPPSPSKRQSQLDEYERILEKVPSHSVSPSPNRRLSVTNLDPEQITPYEPPMEREPTIIEKQNPLIHFARDEEEDEPINTDSILKTMGINPRYYESNKKLINQRIKEKKKDEPLIDIPTDKEIYSNVKVPANKVPLKPKTVNLSLGALASPAVVVIQQQFKRLDPIFNSVVRKLKDLNQVHKRAVIKAQSKIKKLQNITAQQNLAIRQLQYEIQQRDRAILEIGTEEVAETYQKHINQTKEKRAAMNFQILYEKMLFHRLEIEYDETTDPKERTAIERYGQTLLQTTGEHIKESKRLKRELDSQNKQLKNIKKNKNFNEIIYGNQVNDLYTPKMQPKKSPSHFNNQNEEYIPIQYPPPEPELPNVLVGKGLSRLPPMKKYEKMRSLADSKSYSLPQLNYMRETEIALSPIKQRPPFKPYGNKAIKKLHPLTSSVFSPVNFEHSKERLPPTLKKKPYIDF